MSNSLLHLHTKTVVLYYYCSSLSFDRGADASVLCSVLLVVVDMMWSRTNKSVAPRIF